MARFTNYTLNRMVQDEIQREIDKATHVAITASERGEYIGAIYSAADAVNRLHLLYETTKE